MMLSETAHLAPHVGKLGPRGQKVLGAELFLLAAGWPGGRKVQGHLTGLSRTHNQGLSDWHGAPMVNRIPARIIECSGLEGTSGSSSPTPLPKQGQRRGEA